LAVVATLNKGYDLDYIWEQVDRGPAKDAASYYIQATESGGEPPGRWWGPGAKALGFEPGQTIEREPYDLLFGERRAPDGTQFGRPPDGGRNAADLNARLARQAGDRDGDAYWSALVAEVDEMIWQAVHAGFGYFQREATRLSAANAYAAITIGGSRELPYPAAASVPSPSDTFQASHVAICAERQGGKACRGRHGSRYSRLAHPEKKARCSSVVWSSRTARRVRISSS
jgi:hypothetical protein